MQSRLSPGAACGVDVALIDAVVADFYGSVRRDRLLEPIFAERIHDWAEHELLISRFWASVLLMNGAYKGTPLQAHLVLPDLTEVHFERWLALFKLAVSKRCTEAQAGLFMECASRIATSFRMARERFPAEPFPTGRLPIPVQTRSLI